MDYMKERLNIQSELEEVVCEVGKKILADKDQSKGKRQIIDIPDAKHNHEISTLDTNARTHIMTALEEKFHDRVISLQFEFLPNTITPRSNPSKPPLYFVIDEIDGTTNLKRWAANDHNYHPHAAVCIAVCNATSLSSLEIGVVFTLDECELYSAVKLDNETDFGKYYAKHNGISLQADPFNLGDSKNRLLVIGYSSEARLSKARIEEELCKVNDNFRIYEGCRASTIDIINIFRNQYDAYIDARAVLGNKTSTKLEAYDVAAILPCAYACSNTITVSDIYGRPLTEYNRGDPLPLLIAKTEIQHDILNALKKLYENNNVLPTPDEWSTMLKGIRSERSKKIAHHNKKNNKLISKRVPMEVKGISKEKKNGHKKSIKV